MVTFGNEVTKILRNPCLHFARQDGQDGKKPEKKSTNYSDQNIKNQKMKIRDERNIKELLSVEIRENPNFYFGSITFEC